MGRGRGRGIGADSGLGASSHCTSWVNLAPHSRESLVLQELAIVEEVGTRHVVLSVTDTLRGDGVVGPEGAMRGKVMVSVTV